jgi:uncharacterized delta-60 repeat protein
VPARRPLTKVGTDKDLGFPGPISINVPDAGGYSNLVEQDGRFIVVGGSDTVSGQIVQQGAFFARFEADGKPDPSFGQGGSTRIILFAENKMGNVSPVAVALAPSGKIVFARTVSDMFPGNEPGSRVAIARLQSDGSLDPAFGNGGLVYTTIDNQFEATSIAVQRDEKVIVGGYSGHLGSCQAIPCNRYATLMRYLANGQPDPTFGSAGLAQAKLFIDGTPPILSRSSSFSSLFVQENGLIVAVGSVDTGTDASRMLITEYLPTGELNPVFGRSGTVTLAFDGPYQRFGAASVAVRENGRILAGGSADLFEVIEHFNSNTESILVDQAFVLAQLTPGGDLDTTFGKDGKVVIDVNPRVGPPPRRPLDALNKVLLTQSGDIYATGIASGPVGTSDKAINIVALHTDGSLQQNFGKAGLYSAGTYSPWHMWLAQDALLTTDGRLVVSGTHWPDHLPDAFVLWAYAVAGKAGPTTCP